MYKDQILDTLKKEQFQTVSPDYLCNMALQPVIPFKFTHLSLIQHSPFETNRPFLTHRLYLIEQLLFQDYFLISTKSQPKPDDPVLILDKRYYNLNNLKTDLIQFYIKHVIENYDQDEENY